MPIRYLSCVLLLPVCFGLYLQLGTSLSLVEQWQLIVSANTHLHFFDQFLYYYTALPRACLALMVGVALGLAGSLLQQLTRNHLVSPMTLGASAGAWLSLVCASIWFPLLLAKYSVWFAMGGVALSTSVVFLVAGRHGLNSLSIILTGMAVNIFLGAIASVIILLHQEATTNLFIWGAGDLTQTDWHWVSWLLPKLSVGLLVLILAHKPLMLLRLGEQGAQSRGLRLWPALTVCLLAATWLVASVITAVGVIAFIGLLAPNIARVLGARHAFDELLFSAVLGGALLLTTDALAIIASDWTHNVIPSGTTAALIGAPGILLFSRIKSGADSAFISLPMGRAQVSCITWVFMSALLMGSLYLAITLTTSQAGWRIYWPSDVLVSLRWPRVLTAMSAGIGMAVSGAVLQRLIKNPLASPDILGLSAGATLALVIVALISHKNINNIGIIVAITGSLSVLALLLLFGRKSQYAPGSMILIGIALSAFAQGLVQLALAKGGDDIFSIIGWLAGSTYRVSATQALFLAEALLILSIIVFFLHRWLILIGMGDQVAKARGVNTSLARLCLLVLVAMMCALVTAVMGPVAFIGLIAPHLAMILGGKKLIPQLLLAMMLGGSLMVLSDWVGRLLIYPQQLPAGTIAAVFGGAYFIFLLAKARC
ncbi:MAG: Fe(3+)-hydroxamate ABC transporter permease FhuB [Endozoicomonas sp. (ex Botrylloides leachii)]|nr:Fe(3+)-hydroxamate ABC transporter permease FhuB [Endozoicomonas sp. (ex Botrylloides leachii)]